MAIFAPIFFSTLLLLIPQVAAISPNAVVSWRAPFSGTALSSVWPTMQSHYGCNSHTSGNGSFSLRTGVGRIAEKAVALRCHSATGWGNATSQQVVQYESPSFNLTTALHRLIVNWTFTGRLNLTANTSAGAFAEVGIFFTAWLQNSGGNAYFAYWFYGTGVGGFYAPNQKLRQTLSQNASLVFYGYTYPPGPFHVYAQFEVDAYAQSAPNGGAYAKVDFAGPAEGAKLLSIVVL